VKAGERPFGSPFPCRRRAECGGLIAIAFQARRYWTEIDYIDCRYFDQPRAALSLPFLTAKLNKIDALPVEFAPRTRYGCATTES
jgi:hypothetical protein